MFVQLVILFAAVCQLCTIVAQGAVIEPRQNACTAERRLAGVRQIPFAYNQRDLGASNAAFDKVPFADNCVTTIAANGLPPVPVAVDGITTRAFAKSTRQAFSRVTGKYTDFPGNQTALIETRVTLGVRNLIPVPVSFDGQVYCDYDEDCNIKAVRAIAQVPSNLLGQDVSLDDLIPGLDLGLGL